MGSLDHATADHVVTSETLTNGLYFITTQDPDTKQFQRTEVWCDFEAAIPKTFKLVLNADTAVDIKTASPDDVAECKKVGMVLYQPPRDENDQCDGDAGSFAALMAHLGFNQTHPNPVSNCDFQNDVSLEDYGMFAGSNNCQANSGDDALLRVHVLIILTCALTT